MNRNHGARWAAYAALFAVSFINLLSYADMSADAPSRAHDDALRYLAMSKQTFAPVDNPFAFRVLSPWLSHEIQAAGLGLNNSWILLTFVATYVAIVLFFKTLYDHAGLSLFVSLAASTMLACTYWFTCFNFADPYLVDPLANAAIVGAVYACLRRRPAWFAVAMVIGVMDKETMMLFAPLYAITSWARRESWRSRDVVGGTAIAAVVSVFYVAFHAFVRSRLPADGGYTPLSGSGGHSIIDNFRASVSVMKQQQQFAIFDTAHFLWLFFLFGLYYCYRRNGWRDQTLMLGAYSFVVCLFGRLFASDLQRVFAMMVPVIIMVAAVHCLSVLDTEQERWWIAILSLTYVAINLRWVPADASVALDLAAGAAFALKVGMIRHGVPALAAGRLVEPDLHAGTRLGIDPEPALAAEAELPGSRRAE